MSPSTPLFAASAALRSTTAFTSARAVINDYGRPYENGFNNYTGISGYASAGRFLLYVRGEFQTAPSATGYSSDLAQVLSGVDGIPFIDPNTGQPYHQATDSPRAHRHNNARPLS